MSAGSVKSLSDFLGCKVSSDGVKLGSFSSHAPLIFYDKSSDFLLGNEMSNQNDSEQWEDSATEVVKKLRNEGNFVASLLLCSAFVEHYCKTRLFIFLTSNRRIEIIKVRDKKTKELKNAAIWCKMEDSIKRMNHARTIDVGLLVGAWNYELWNELRVFNKNRNDFVHQHEYILKMLKTDDEEKAKKIIERGLALLHNIKFGYLDSKRKVVKR